MVAQIAWLNKCLASRPWARDRLDVIIIRGVGDREANEVSFALGGSPMSPSRALACALTIAAVLFAAFAAPPVRAEAMGIALEGFP